MKATTGTLLSAAAGTQLGRKMGLGLDGDVAPRSKIDAPRGSAALNRGWWAGSRTTVALIPCYEWKREEQ
jgi:hypothetical protein